MRETWTDARLDDFRVEVNRRFDKVEGEIAVLRGEVKELRSEMKAGFESLHRTLVHASIGLSASFIAAFAAIATQL